MQQAGTISSPLDRLAARLRELEVEALRLSESDLPGDRLDTKRTYKKRLEQLDASHSRSWFGDHSATYFAEFNPPPAGRTFDVEWGFIPHLSRPANPGWRVFSRDDIRRFVFQDIGEAIFYEVNQLSDTVSDRFQILLDQSLDVLEVLSSKFGLESVGRYRNKIRDNLKPYTIADYINGLAKSTPRMTRDSVEIAKGQTVPAYVQYFAPFQTLVVNKGALQDLASLLRNAIEVVAMNKPESNMVDPSRMIFIGHGRSEQWRALKDFIVDRLRFGVEEFNRVSPAGLSTQERLSEMMAHCGFAFLVLTGEDIRANKSIHARENVIHEAGLFQGRLGWRRAIIVLEEGCEEFSNIVGLGQIRFSKGNIPTCFEEVRRVLEREAWLKS